MDTVDTTGLFPGVEAPTSPNGKGPDDTIRLKGTDDRFSDARLAETLAHELLEGRFLWAIGLEWLTWNGKRWSECDEVEVLEAVRIYALNKHEAAAAELKTGGKMSTVEGWKSFLGLHHRKRVLSDARGLVACKAEELDADPDLVNTPSGVVDLRTGDILEHRPELLMTKITSGGYKPGTTHPDWIKALEALDPPEREWLQVRIGQAITGYTTPDGILPVCQGSGENGKGVILTDGLVPALGGYASMASAKLFQSTKGNEHSTERADLRGRRLVVAEELTEGRSIDVTALKQIQDVGRIRARYVYQNNMEFQASHSLFTTSNYIPVVAETDHGTWRRLALLRFRYTFRKTGEPLVAETDRRGDEGLKSRIRDNVSGQHDALVTWAIEGAVRWYKGGPAEMAKTKTIRADTDAWQADADRIVGFWRDRLIADRDACMITTEVREEFNAWLRANGHNEWSKELFGPRFLNHSETAKHGIDEKRLRSPKGLKRPPGAFKKPPEQVAVYRGLRCREPEDPADQEEQDSVQSVHTPKELSHAREIPREVPKRSAHSAQTAKEHEDPIDHWRRDRCLVGRFVARNKELYQDFVEWYGTDEVMTSQKFLSKLRQLGHVAIKGQSTHRVGIALKPREDPDADITVALGALRDAGLLGGRGHITGDGGAAWQARLREGPDSLPDEPDPDLLDTPPSTPMSPLDEEKWGWIYDES